MNSCQISNLFPKGNHFYHSIVKSIDGKEHGHLKVIINNGIHGLTFKWSENSSDKGNLTVINLPGSLPGMSDVKKIDKDNNTIELKLNKKYLATIFKESMDHYF